MRAPSPLFYQARASQKSMMSEVTSAVVCLTLMGLLVLLGPRGVSECHAEGEGAEAVERALDPFLTSAQYRDQDERVDLTDGRAEVWLLESLEQGDLAAKVCNGARWLIGGRLKQSTGARGAFSVLPELRELSLIFYKIKTKVDPNLEGRYVQQRSAVTAARFTLSRERAMMIHSERVMTLLQGPQCAEQAKQLLDDLWVSPDVMKSREALSVLKAKRKPVVQP